MAQAGRGSTRQQQAAAARRAEQQRRRWEEQERKRLEREQVQQLKAAERQQREAEQQRKIDDAAARTSSIERRLADLTGIIAKAVARPTRPLDFDALKSVAREPVLDLGVDAKPQQPPRWETFAPDLPGVVGRAFGGRARYERQLAIAEDSFARARQAHDDQEAARQRRVVQARERHAAEVAQARRAVEEQHERVDRWRAEVLAGDRRAVSAYYQRVIDAVPTPDGFPSARRAAYVPESTLLLIEWDLPGTAVVPVEKEYQYIKTRDVVEVRKSRPVDEIRRTYQSIVSQVALQALHAAFRSDPGSFVETVVFNGVTEAVDPATGQPIRPYLITLRATREHFDKVNLAQADPVQCVRKHFAAEVSDHPEALTPVEPLLHFDMADPRIVDPQDVISGMDRRPNLMDLTPKEFESFVQNLFDRLGFDTKLFQASGDGGIDCIAYDPTPIRGGKYVIQVKQYSKTVPPTAVRDLFGTVHDQGATKGILITTSGFGPSSHEFANGKPLQLYDGTRLLGLCKQIGIEARIVMPPKGKRTK
jgi:restriction system protein